MIKFKFQYLNDQGREAGLGAKKGRFDGETLTLAKDTIPIIAVLRADRRFNRIILTLLQEDGAAVPLVFAVKSGNVKKLLAAINRETSRRWAALRQEDLNGKGSGEFLRLETCPYCESTIDVTDFPATRQVFCNYCDTIVTLEGPKPDKEPEHALCDGCGYFSRPREFSTFYFYFLLVIYGVSHGKRYVCSACMRAEAWKMFFGNLIFILGVPFAVIQLLRVYLGGKFGSSFPGLDNANIKARKGRVDEAIRQYVEICRNVSDYSGIRYNAGLALHRGDDAAKAATQFENALALCSNHGPSFEAACACHRQSGQTDQLAALERAWGVDQSPGEAPAGEAPTAG